MTLHQFDENMKPDSEYFYGDLSFLVPGNVCRLLDGRRTPGFIEEVCTESAMFRWRISNFEDKGRYWDVPLEHIDDYQFENLNVQDNLRQIQELSEIFFEYKSRTEPEKATGVREKV